MIRVPNSTLKLNPVSDSNNTIDLAAMNPDQTSSSSSSSSSSPSPSNSLFDKDRHVKFLEMMYQYIPSDYQGQEINRLTLAYFVISGLDILGSLHLVDREEISSWVLSFQAHPTSKAELMSNGEFYGFYGSRTSQFPPDENGVFIHNGSHLASTYCALAILKIVGCDFSLVDSDPILKSMRHLQQPDGCSGLYIVLLFGLSAAICSILDDWSGMDKDKAKDYIVNCQSYDGGFGLIPGSESHGGATYCAVASLRLMGFIEDDILSKSSPVADINLSLLLDWSFQRQGADGGFQGRTNKQTDTCYAFWIGVLKILGAQNFIDRSALQGFLHTCQSKYGGFSKFPRGMPDLYHSYYGISAFSLLEEHGLNPICFELGVTDIAATSI